MSIGSLNAMKVPMTDTTASTYFNAELVAGYSELKQQVALLKSELVTAQKVIEETAAKLDSTTAKLDSAERDRNFYKHKMELLQRNLFGKSSERRAHELLLGNQPLLPGFEDTERPVPPPMPEQRIEYTRRKPIPEGTRGARATRFPAWLPREEVILSPESTECACCGGTLTPFGNPEITEKLCCNRNPFFVKEYHRQVHACTNCDAVAPRVEVPAVFERSLFDHTAIAYFIVNKYQYALPAVRQYSMLKDLDIKVSSDSIIRGVNDGLSLLNPVGECLVRSTLSSDIIVVDDTRFSAATGEIKTKLPRYKQGCLWGIFGAANEVVYRFSNSRTNQSCRELLAGFKGYIVCDAYQGFDHVALNDPNITLVNCGNHARRKFVNAEIEDNVRAGEALAFYQALYRIEDEAKDLSPAERFEYRNIHACPILETFHSWLNIVHVAADKRGLLHNATAYVLSRWTSLTAYLKDGRLPFDSMQIERAFRSVAVGRKNFLHASSELGAENAALAYSLINSCILVDVDPFLYLCDVLERISYHKAADLEDLLPRNWKKLYLASAQARYLPTVSKDDGG